MVHRSILLGDLDAFELFRKTLRNLFLKKSRRSDTPMESLHRDGAPSDMRQHHRGDLFVVGSELALGDPFTRKQDLLGMRDHGSPRVLCDSGSLWCSTVIQPQRRRDTENSQRIIIS